jgi:uncharacterized protein YcfJ
VTRRLALGIPLALLVTACATLPPGPSVMVLPGTLKTFEDFQTDDAVCRQWAALQTGTTRKRAAGESAASGATIGTVLGAALGAAFGAAAGNPGIGAAVGAGTGLLGGTVVGADTAEGAAYEVQHRYDMAYMQCMYSKGNQIPVARGLLPAYTAISPEPADVPPPPGRVGQ